MSLSTADIQKTIPTPGLPPQPANPSLTLPTALQPFSKILDQLTSRNPAPANSNPPDPARQAQADKAAGDLISNALILPMLKQLRRSPWSENTVFSPGIGEKTFGPQFDIQISDRIAHNPRLGLKTALAQRLMKHGPTAVPPVNDPGATLTAHARLNLHG